jgi:integrase
MDTMVGGIGERVVAALEAAGYAESTIGQYRKSLGCLELLARKQAGVYTLALGAEFASMTTSPRTGNFSAQRRFDYGRLVSVFNSYVPTGQVDLAMKRHGEGRATPQSKEFIALLGAWSVEMELRGLAAATRGAYGRAACDYLLYLEARGMTSLRVADGTSVLGFLESLRGRWAESAMWSVVTNFRPFLNFTQRFDLLNALKMAGANRFPAWQRRRTSCSSSLHPRTSSRARCNDQLLALVTGLRACDLVALRLKDIDWRGSTIGIVQQKTSNPLRLPLPPLIIGKLAKYVLDERPDSVDDHVFLRAVAPHTELADHASIYEVTRRVFKAAGVDRPRVGTRLLRHNAASRLLRAGTPLPTISAVLGHSSPDSTNVYLSTDTEHPLACVLPLPLALQQGAVR